MTSTQDRRADSTGQTKATPSDAVLVIGAGYVGTSLAQACSAAGLQVLVNDRSREALDDVGRLEGVQSIEDLRELDATPPVCILAVNTPVIEHEPDYAPLRQAASSLGGVLSPGTLVINECTVGPGATRTVVADAIERASGLRPGEDYDLAYSPERIDPGNLRYDLRTTPKLVAGWDLASLDRAMNFYATFVDVVHGYQRIEELEFAKIYENAARAVAIAFANEASEAARELGLDPARIFAAADTKPFGHLPVRPGPGVGGDCVPTDPWYLISALRRASSGRLDILEASLLRNESMPLRTVEEVEALLASRGVSTKDARVAVLGVGYKPNQASVTNSPGARVVARLLERGAEVVVFDPLVRATGADLLAGVRLVEETELQRSMPDVGVVCAMHDCIRSLLPALSFPMFDPSATIGGATGDVWSA